MALVALFALLCVIFFFGFLVGHWLTYETLIGQVIKNKRAYWHCDPVSGTKTLVWADPPQNS